MRIGNHVLVNGVMTEITNIEHDHNPIKGIPIDKNFYRENSYTDLYERGEVRASLWRRKDADCYMLNIKMTLNSVFFEMSLPVIKKYVHELENLLYDITGEHPIFTFNYLQL